MLFKLNLLRTASFCLLLLNGILLQGQIDGPANSGDDENPFGSGKVTGGDGGGDKPCDNSLNPIFSVDMFNVKQQNGDLNSFPCLLQVGITDINGTTVYVDLFPEDFAAVPAATLLAGTGDGNDWSGRFRAYIESPLALSIPMLLSEPCVNGEKHFEFLLEFFCVDLDENDNEVRTPIEYCGENSGWEDFLSPIVGTPPTDCDELENTGISGYAVYELCCRGIGDGTSVHVGPGTRPLTKDNSSDFDVYANFSSTTVVVTSESNSSNEVIFTDMTGRTVYRSTSQQHTFNIDHTGLQAGLYFVTVYSNGHATTKKVFVQ